jgi:hypothetical protein
MNDLTLVHVRLDEDQDEPERIFYWNRLAISHFTEPGLFIFETANVAEVEAFVESLGAETRDKYDECLAVFEELRGRLFDTRNKATFHYPKLRPTTPGAARPVRDALVALREDRGVIRSARMRDARALFADDVVVTIFVDVLGGMDAIEPFEARVAEGTTAFIRFANLALDEHLMGRRAAGAGVDDVELVDPEDPRAVGESFRRRRRRSSREPECENPQRGRARSLPRAAEINLL